MIGERTTFKRAAVVTAVTAAGSGDNTAITGIIIDRADTKYAKECCVIITYTTTLAAAATLKFKTASIQHDDASNLGSAAAHATLEDSSGTIIATGPGGGGTVTGVKKYNVNLGGCKRYVRFDMTPDLSAANTDTASIGAAVIAFSDMYQYPAL